MFVSWGRIVVRARWAVIAATAAITAAGLVWGTGVFGLLQPGGFEDPGSESAKATSRIVAEVGRQDVDVIALYTDRSDRRLTVDDQAFRAPVSAVAATLRARPEVTSVVSYYDTHAAAFVSHDRRATYLAIRLAAADSDRQYQAIKALLPAPGLDTQVGGPSALSADIGGRVSTDIGRAEAYSMPILFLLLLLVFRGVIAALTPLLIGGFAILGAFTATRALTYATDVSVFALNIITLLGLGMAVDYALFMVSRFREELDNGRSVPEAVQRTVATAGRTVAVSGLTVALALASLLIFPQVFLRSMGFGGMAAVLVAMLGALTFLPAMLAVLGRRINALRVPLPRLPRRAAGSAGRAGWARLAHAVMRRPVAVAVGTVAVLALLAAPFWHAEFGGSDARVLPAGTQSRQVGERLAAQFDSGAASHIDVLVSGADATAVERFAADLARLPRATGATVTASRGRSSLISVTYRGEDSDPGPRQLVNDIRALRDARAPAGARVLVGGYPAHLVDLLHSLAVRLPWMGLLVASMIMVLLFLAFGSVVLPIKAILMSVVSIGASFGAVVWVFQDAHLAGLLGFTPTGYLEATQLILMLGMIFGLSTDYEVFLLSRVREEWLSSRDNTAAVASGLQRTGSIITAAALLLVIVVGGFATGGITFIKMIGVGMIVAILVDATIVRALLVPATMRLLGRANWWAPAALARLHRRIAPHAGDLAEPGDLPGPRVIAAGDPGPGGRSMVPELVGRR